MDDTNRPGDGWDEDEDGYGEPDLPELCDECGVTIEDEADELYALVPDSSAINDADPRGDGKRLLTACSIDHLAQLVEVYRRRPFQPEELWAAKVCRELAQTDGPVTLEALAVACDLSPQQAQSGVDWHNARAREWRHRFGGEP
ncbi:hypothetical protein C7C46_28245 [Streptomyces tateyamensis]|uniref:Uncharacterized protein n=1 Tax=Streptomyces tateyamensis TaxID=565073 RepID=A0A2V4NYV7_9ACTN|nr:hypothetical protein [Streptomyces tateyamensis]PYC69144.1 hypothetical protein C7C46_28245 [Streptomyces tateyamensis]